MNKQIRRYAFTLIEVMIALGLTTALLSSLLRWYKHGAVEHAKKRGEKALVYAQEKMHLRLSHVFGSLSKKEISCSLNSLAFEYDNGAEKKAGFCGPLDALLFFKEKQICLAAWSKKEKNLGRKEVLLDNVSSFSFEFFDPKEKKWRPDWQDKDLCPVMIKLHVDKETFVYFL